MLAARHNCHIFDTKLFEQHKSGELDGTRRGLSTEMPRSVVLIHGLHGSGKTTFLNGLLGEALFPYFTEKPDSPAQKEPAEHLEGVSIFDIRARPSVAWNNVPVRALIQRDRHNSIQKVLDVRVPPFLADHPSRDYSAKAQLKVWPESFHPNADDAPLPANPISVPVTLPFDDKREDAPSKDFVLVDDDTGASATDERQRAQAGSLGRFMEDTAGRMVRQPHFMTVDCVPMAGDDDVARSEASSSSGEELLRMGFVEGQEVTDRPPMHRIHTVIYVLDEEELLSNPKTEHRSSVFTSARAALTCDATRCKAYLVVNQRQKTSKSPTDQPRGPAMTQDMYARQFRIPARNVFMIDCRAALATSLLGNIGAAGVELQTPRNAARLLTTIREEIVKNHVQAVAPWRAARIAATQGLEAGMQLTNSMFLEDDTASNATTGSSFVDVGAVSLQEGSEFDDCSVASDLGEAPQRATDIEPPSESSGAFRMSLKALPVAPTTDTPLPESEKQTPSATPSTEETAPTAGNSGYVPVVLRQSYQAEAESTARAAAASLEPTTAPGTSDVQPHEYRPRCTDDTSSPVGSNTYVPRILRDEQDREAAAQYQSSNSYVPKVLRE